MDVFTRVWETLDGSDIVEVKGMSLNDLKTEEAKLRNRKKNKISLNKSKGCVAYFIGTTHVGKKEFYDYLPK